MFCEKNIIIIISLIISVTSKPIQEKLVDDLEELKLEEKIIAEKILQSIMEEIFEKFIEPNLNEKQKKSEYSKYFDEIEEDEKMLADTPNSDTILVPDNENLKNLMATLNKNSSNLTSPYYTFKNNITAERESAKKQRLMLIQQSVLELVGRMNNSTSVPPSITAPVVWILNRTGSVQPDNKDESETEGDEFVNKKIRSFYPSCDIPRNTDEDAWKETNTMNLFFNVNYDNNGGVEKTDEDSVNIASATLRLYRVPQDNATESAQKNSNVHSLNDEDKQIRVSVYWYSRSLKKHKAVRKRLADSRMVSIQSNSSIPRQYVEFNVRPAAKTWVRGRNLGLGVVVEDVDGNHLNPGEYFKGAQCDTVGNVSTPIPIPTPFLDGLVNKTLYTPYDTLMPKLDICTIDPAYNLSDTSKISCRVVSTTAPKPIQRDLYETGRHIRHHHTPDFRDKFVSKRVVMKNGQINYINNQMQQQNDSVVNR